ncbi:MAG: UrcA family protein [Allosphingosinicella sp.]
MSVRTTFLAAAAVVAGLCNIGLGVSPALAQSADGIAVSYADLDLATQPDRQRLDRRIANAAEQLCGRYSPLELDWALAVRACQSETIALTQPQRDAAMGIRGEVQVSSADRVIRVNRAAN